MYTTHDFGSGLQMQIAQDIAYCVNAQLLKFLIISSSEQHIVMDVEEAFAERDTFASKD
jgi:hypothetical protein